MRAGTRWKRRCGWFNDVQVESVSSIPSIDIEFVLVSSGKDGGLFSIVVDLWRFARHRKKLWLVPLMVMAVVYGAHAVFTKGSVLAPFIYTVLTVADRWRDRGLWLRSKDSFFP